MQKIKELTLQASINVTRQIKERVAWFYARHLQNTGTNISAITNALLTREERMALSEPQGDKEKEILLGPCTRSALLEAQIYDRIAAYTKPFFMRDEQTPEIIRQQMNNRLLSFQEQTMNTLRDTLSACFRQGNTVDQTASALEQTVTKTVNKLAADIEVYYSKASWYRILQQYVAAGYDHFRYIIEVTDNTCRTCLSQSQRTYTLEQLVQLDLLPPLHPNCRCTIVPESDEIVLNNLEEDTNWYDPFLRIPSDAFSLLKGFADSQKERLDRGTLSGFLDWLTMGMVSGFVDGLAERNEKLWEQPSAYNLLNWATLGMADMVKGAIDPEEPLSLEHWLNSLGVVSVLYASYAALQPKSSIRLETHNSNRLHASNENTLSRTGSRPSWRQSELDGALDYPDHLPQQSFLQGKPVPYGTKGSVRPDFYCKGSSIDYKNYDISTAVKRNNLVRNITNQYFRRVAELPSGTIQTFVIDIRGQAIGDSVLNELYDIIMVRTSYRPNIYFKVQ